jgi:hypothetical protein
MPKKKTTATTRRVVKPRNLKPSAPKVTNIRGGLGTIKGESTDSKHKDW